MKGQELPINTIVLIVLVLIILVLALVFIVLPIARTPTPSPQSISSIETFTESCSTYCYNAANSQAGDAPWNTQFCTATTAYQGHTYHCYSDSPSTSTPIYECGYEAYNGTFYTDIGQIICSK